MSKPLERDAALAGYTYKLKWPESEHAIYVTINDIEAPDGPGQPARRRPFEIFINTKNLEHYAWTVALTRMISAVFRRGGDVTFVAEELKAVFDPQGGRWMGGRYVPSLLGGHRPGDRGPHGPHRLHRAANDSRPPDSRSAADPGDGTATSPAARGASPAAPARAARRQLRPRRGLLGVPELRLLPLRLDRRRFGGRRTRSWLTKSLTFKNFRTPCRALDRLVQVPEHVSRQSSLCR